MLAVSASDEPNDGRKTAGEDRRTDLRGSVRGKRNGATRWKATTSPRNVLLRCVVTVQTNAVANLPVSKLRRLIKRTSTRKSCANRPVSPLFRSPFRSPNRASFAKPLPTRGEGIWRGKNRRESRDNERNAGDDRDEDDESALVSDRPFVSRRAVLPKDESGRVTSYVNEHALRTTAVK